MCGMIAVLSRFTSPATSRIALESAESRVRFARIVELALAVVVMLVAATLGLSLSVPELCEEGEGDVVKAVRVSERFFCPL